MNNGRITWSEVDGNGTLTLVWDDGHRETVAHATPITAATNSSEIADLFGGADVVGHDRDCVHIAKQGH